MHIAVSENRLVLEEEYMGRRWLVLIALVLAGMAFAPAVVTVREKGTVSVTMLGISCCMVVFVFYLPFFAVLAFSRYRRVVIDRAEGFVEAQVVFRLRPSRVTRVPFDAVQQIVCDLIPDSDGPDGMRIRLVTRDGTEVPLITRSVWSDGAVQRLREIFGEKVGAPEV